MYSHDYKSTWQTYIYLLNESWLQTESFKDFTTYIWHEDSLLPSVLWVKPWEHLCKMDLHLNDRTLWLNQIHEASNVTYIPCLKRAVVHLVYTKILHLEQKQNHLLQLFSVIYHWLWCNWKSVMNYSQLTVKKTSVCMFFSFFLTFHNNSWLLRRTVTCAVLSSPNVYQKLRCNFFFLNLISTQQTSVHYQIGIVLLFHAMWFRYRI